MLPSDDEECISRGTPGFNFSQDLVFQRRMSQTPVNSPRKSLVEANNNDKLIMQLNQQNQEDICEEENEKPENDPEDEAVDPQEDNESDYKSSADSQRKAELFVKTPKVQNLIQ